MFVYKKQCLRYDLTVRFSEYIINIIKTDKTTKGMYGYVK